MIERRLRLGALLLFAGALAVSCGGSSISRSQDGDEDADDDVGGNGGSVSSGGVTTGGRSGGGTTGSGGVSTGGASTGGVGAAAGGLGGGAGRMQGGRGGAGGGGGDAGDALCPDEPAGATPCGGDLIGTWVAAGCSLSLSGVVDVSGIGLSTECLSPPVTGSVQITGSVTFDEMTYSDHTVTSGDARFELGPECLEISGTMTTCDVLANPLQSLGYRSVSCTVNAATMGCSCIGTIQQMGGLGFISHDASTSGTYATEGDDVTLSEFGIDTEYSYCVSDDAQLLALSLQTVSRTGTLADPIVLVKQ
jgi:hypothetical protein